MGGKKDQKKAAAAAAPPPDGDGGLKSPAHSTRSKTGATPAKDKDGAKAASPPPAAGPAAGAATVPPGTATAPPTAAAPPPPAPDAAAEAARLKKLQPFTTKVVLLRQQFELRCKEADRVLRASSKGTPTEVMFRDLVSKKEKLEEARDDLSKAYHALAQADLPELLGTYTAKLNNAIAPADGIIDHLYDISQDFEIQLLASKEAREKASRDALTGDATFVKEPFKLGPTSHKPNNALKPPILQRDNTPVERTVWAKQFLAYYTSSKMEKCTLPEQHAYIKACLEPGLVVRLDALIADDTPVFTELAPSAADPTVLEEVGTSVMAMLDQVFLEIYPIFNRRHDYHCAMQPQGMLASDWLSELAKMRDECALEQMDLEDRFVQRILTSLHDQKLKKELLDLDDVSIDSVVRAVAKWETTKKSLKNPGNSFMKGVKSSPTANTAASNLSKSNSQKGSKGSNSKQQTTSAPVNKPVTSTPAKQHSQPYQCYRCGNRDPKHACKAKQAVCKKCKKQGHYMGMCGSKLRAKVFNVQTNVVDASSIPSTAQSN